jgi:CDP-diacylglycerol--serine O-phosphatidyltransferase
MLCGILSIFLSLSGRLDLAPYPIFLGAIFDFLDGFVARLLKQQGELGKQLDSLADMVTFGLAPGIMMMGIFVISLDITSFRMYSGDFYYLNWIKNALQLQVDNYLPFLALLIPVFSMFRLAKFNLDTRQTEGFIGLNTPANTLLLCTFPLILAQDFEMGSINYLAREFVLNPWFLTPLIVVLCVLLISEIPIFSLKFKYFKWKGNEIRFIFLITCSLIIPLTLYWSMGIIVILYIILSVIDNFLKKKKHEIQS